MESGPSGPRPHVTCDRCGRVGRVNSRLVGRFADGSEQTAAVAERRLWSGFAGSPVSSRTDRPDRHAAGGQGGYSGIRLHNDERDAAHHESDGCHDRGGRACGDSHYSEYASTRCPDDSPMHPNAVLWQGRMTVANGWVGRDRHGTRVVVRTFTLVAFEPCDRVGTLTAGARSPLPRVVGQLNACVR